MAAEGSRAGIWCWDFRLVIWEHDTRVVSTIPEHVFRVYAAVPSVITKSSKNSVLARDLLLCSSSTP